MAEPPFNYIIPFRTVNLTVTIIISYINVYFYHTVAILHFGRDPYEGKRSYDTEGDPHQPGGNGGGGGQNADTL
jgi:hypothetical protein